MTPEKPSPAGIVLMRACPFTRGHLAQVQAVVEECGRCVILLGSKNAHRWPDIPFTFEERREMVEKSLPEELKPFVEIRSIADSNPDDTGKWNIEQWHGFIRSELHDLLPNCVFFGGSAEDLKHLAEEFETKVIVPREEGEVSGVNATLVRELLADVLIENILGNSDEEQGIRARLAEILAPQIIDIAIEAYRRNALLFTSKK